MRLAARDGVAGHARGRDVVGDEHLELLVPCALRRGRAPALAVGSMPVDDVLADVALECRGGDAERGQSDGALDGILDASRERIRTVCLAGVCATR